MNKQIERAIRHEDAKALELLLFIIERKNNKKDINVPSHLISFCLFYHKNPRCYELLCLHNCITRGKLDVSLACCNRDPHLFEHLLWSGVDREWMSKRNDDNHQTLQQYQETHFLLFGLLMVRVPNVIAERVRTQDRRFSTTLRNFRETINTLPHLLSVCLGKDVASIIISFFNEKK